MAMKKKGVPTPEDVSANAKRTYAHFSPTNVRALLGIGRKDSYFYVWGFTPEGKQMCWGPMPSGLEEAKAAARGLIEGEVFELDTRDLNKAKQEIKAELLRRGVSPDNALRRMYTKHADEDIEHAKRVLL